MERELYLQSGTEYLVPALVFVFGIALAGITWPGQTGAKEMLSWAVAAVACPTFLFLVKIRPTPIHYWGAGLLAWASLSLLWSPVFDDALYEVMQLLFMACIFVVAAEMDSAAPLYRSLGLGMLVSFGVVILQLGGLDPVVVAPATSAPTGLFVNSNVLGWTSAVVFVLLIAQGRWFDYALSVPIGFCLVMSDCRSAIGAAFLCFVGLAWQRSRWFGGAIAASAAVLIVHRYHRFEDGASLLQRADIWRDTIKGLTPFGHGIGSFYSMFFAYSTGLSPDGYWLDLSHAHNDALELAFELGIPGLVFCGAIVTLAFKYGGKAERYGLACMGIVSMFGFPLHQPVTQILFAAMAGNAARGWHRLRHTEFIRYVATHRRNRKSIFRAALKGRSAIPA